MSSGVIQFLVFLLLNAAVGVMTWIHCRKAHRGSNEAREYFLASGGLSWAFIAGSITLTNINTDTFVGMYVNQLTLDYGTRGRAALERFFSEAYEKALIPQRVPVEFV